MNEEKPLKWVMRFEFKVKPPFSSSDKELKVNLGKREILLKSANAEEHLAGSTNCVIIAKDFDSELEAIEFGNSLKNAIKLSSIRLSFGVITGPENEKNEKTKEDYDKEYSDSGDILVNEYVGVHVYPDYRLSRYQIGRPILTITRPTKPFFEELEKNLDSEINLEDKSNEIPKKIMTAYDLYTACGMQDSDVGKFILAMSAIEQLSETEVKKSLDEIDLLDKCILLVENLNADVNAKNNIKNYLANGKNISKGEAGRRLVKKHSEDISLYRKLSDFRGKIAHPSRKEDIDKLSRLALEAQCLAGRLIGKSMKLN